MTTTHLRDKVLAMRKEDKPFSGTEVGALIESLRNDIALVAEGQGAMREDIAVLKSDVKELKADMRVVKDILRVEIPKNNSRLSTLEAKVFP